MTEPTIICPSCKTAIKLTESLAAPLVESMRQQYEGRIAEKDVEVARREAALRAQQVELAAAQAKIDERVATELKAGRAAIAAEEAAKARLALGGDLEQRSRELAEAQVLIAERDAKLVEAQAAQVEAVRKQRELDEARRELELTIEKQVSAKLGITREQAKKEAEDGLRLKVAEREETIASMQRQIEELKRRAEQGSQQLQGEVQELELETLLRESFPFDTIDPVAKGEYGGDVLQRIVDPLGRACGSILWESKRTRNWTDGWLAKLREDQRAAKAELAVIVSQALPKGVETFALVDDVWVTSFRCVVPVATVLRQGLVEIGAARAAGEGQQTKMELVYQYLTGSRFRQRVQAIVEKFSDMRDDLERERKAMTRLWAKREEQLRGVLESTAGLYGDLQGIAGKSLQEIEGLDLKQLPEGRDEG